MALSAETSRMKMFEPGPFYFGRLIVAYTIYIGNKNYSSWSLRGWLLVRASGAPFAERLVSLAANDQSGAYKKFSPSGLVPCLVDSSTKPDTVVWDTMSIAEYLAERHPGLWPADATARAWARSICAEMHAGFRTVRNEMAMCIKERVDVRPWSPALQRDIDRICAIWNETSDTAPMPVRTRSISNAPPSGRRLTVYCAFSTSAGVYSALIVRKAAARWVVWRV